MTRMSRAASATAFMLGAPVRPVPAFLVGPSPTRATCFTSARTPLQAGKGFGDKPKPPQEPPKDNKAPRKAKSLMPLADKAASKLLVKEGPDGAVKFDNPAVGDFQVLDALVEVRAALSKFFFARRAAQPLPVISTPVCRNHGLRLMSAVDHITGWL